MKGTQILCRVVFVCAGLSLVVGCVPYQTMQDTKAKLEQAQLANRDLVRKLNQLQLKLAALEAQGPQEGVSQAEYNQIKAKAAELEARLRSTPVPFRDDAVGKVDGARSEDGGIQLGEALLFNEGMHKIKASALRSLDQLAALLRTDYPGEVYVIEGHTDNQPINRTRSLYPDNWELGYKRARAVYEYLIDKGIPKEQMRLTTFGYMKPLDPKTANTAEGRRLNRRVVIRRLPGARI